MSPYLFILCMVERLSRSIDRAVNSKALAPISITTGGSKIPHLFFVDYLALFSKANQENYLSITNILPSFCH